MDCFFFFFLTTENFHLVREQEVQKSPQQCVLSINVNGQKKEKKKQRKEKRAEMVPTSCFSRALRPLPGTPIVCCNNNFSPVKTAPLCRRETSTSILPPVIPPHLKETSVKITTSDNNDVFSQQSVEEQGRTPPNGLLRSGEVGGNSGWTAEEPNNTKKKKKKSGEEGEEKKGHLYL